MAFLNEFWPLCRDLDNTMRVGTGFCRGGFDFSLLFEETILEILPISLVLIVVPSRLWHLAQRRHKVRLSWLLLFKLVAWFFLLGLQGAQTVLWSLSAADRTKASIPANGVLTGGVLVLCLLSCAEHTRSVRPSFILNTYLFCSLLFDIARARTLWLRHASGVNMVISIVTSVAVGAKMLLIILEAIEKRNILEPEYADYPPEATAGFYNRVFFWWLNPLFKRGFSNVLSVNDLFDLDKEMSSERLMVKFAERWSKVRINSPNTLQSESFKAAKLPLLAGVPARVCVVAFNFCQPLLLTRTLAFFNAPVNSYTTNVGYGLIGAYVLVYIGLALSMGQYQHLTYRGITMVRGILITMLYRKAGSLSINETDPANSLTLMSADVERITQGWQTLHEIWANPIEIGLAIFLLERQLGISCAVPVCVALVALIGSMIGMSFVVSRQAKWLEAIERRISSTSGMLGAIKGVKMLGLQTSFMNFIHGLRIDELNISKEFRRLLVWNMAFAWLTRIFAPICTFGVFIAISNSTLNESRVFTSLALFSLLADPLLTLVMSLMSFFGSVGSFARIQEFLTKEDHSDPRRRPSRTLFLDDLGEAKLLFKSGDLEGSSSTFGSMESLKRAGSTSLTNAIMVENASFGWEAKKEPILKNITFTVPRGSLTMLIGPSGCGKSSLLKAILGEIPFTNGKVELSSSSVAFCDQTPWHMNGNIRDSIVAMSAFDAKWYASVIHACAMEEDLAQFPRGDQTVIGSKGIALSGGQSQRIALARAVYARRKIIILDDALCGLDATTENHVFHSLFGKSGLLREIGISVLIASSSVKRLPYSDHIIVLDRAGRIIEQGGFGSLNKSSGYVSSFGLGAPNWQYKFKRSSASPSYSTIDSIQKEKEAMPGEPKGERRGTGGDISIYLYYVNAIGWFPAIVFIVAMAGFVFCISFPSIWLKWWARSNSTEPKQHIAYYLGIYVMLGCVAMLCLIVGCWQMVITMVPKSGESFHRKLLTTVLNAPMLFFSMTDSGVILNRFSQDLQLIDMELPIAAINTIATFFLCIAQMVLIGVASKWAAISFPIVLGVLFVIQKLYLRTSRQLRLLDLEAKAPLYSHFTDCLNGLVTLRAFGWQHAMEKKNIELLDHSQKPFYFMFAIQRWLTLSLDLVVASIAILLIVLIVVLRGTFSAGYVGVALLNVIMFSQSIKLLVTFWTNLETHIGSILRIKDFTQNVKPEDQPGEDGDVPPNWPSKGAVTFNSVSAAYRPEEPVLNDVSLSVGAGEKVGICGRTGSGKTSMIMSIFRMLEVTGGTITLDGVDLTRLPRREIRSRINGVSQDSLLIKGSIRANADPAGAHSDQDIWDALKSVQLLRTIRAKGHLSTDIDELHLSHGQRQLFCLARALLRSGNIIILDEATSNIDPKTDEIMQRVIREKFCNHTILAVAHKLDTILDFDRIVVLDAGRIVEAGEPFALLSDPKSHFSRLYASSVARDEDSD